MAPAIRDGDLVVLDAGRVEPLDGQVFVVRTGEGVQVKRLRRADDRWYLESDNSACEPRAVTGQDRILGSGRVDGATVRSAIEPATWSASVRTFGTGSDGFKVRMRSRTPGTSAAGSPVVRTTRCATPVGARRHGMYIAPARGASSPRCFTSLTTAMTGEYLRAMPRTSKS